MLQIIRLESERTQWEQRYLEESAMRQVAIDAASIPKDAKIAALEKNSAGIVTDPVSVDSLTTSGLAKGQEKLLKQLHKFGSSIKKYAHDHSQNVAESEKMIAEARSDKLKQFQEMQNTQVKIQDKKLFNALFTFLRACLLSHLITYLSYILLFLFYRDRSL